MAPSIALSPFRPHAYSETRERIAILMPPKLQIGYFVSMAGCAFLAQLFQSGYPIAAAFAVFLCSIFFTAYRARAELKKTDHFSPKNDLLFILAAFSISFLLIYPILQSANT